MNVELLRRKVIKKPFIIIIIIIIIIIRNFEHTAQMVDIINKARTKQRSLVITLLDHKNAFGEVHHNLIQTAIDYHHTTFPIILNHR